MNSVQTLFSNTGKIFIFLYEILLTGLRTPCSYQSIVSQTYRVFQLSWPTTAWAGFFVGAIMAVQFTLQVKEFGALGSLGGLVTSVTFREVGPLLIALMLSGKVGAFTAAELGIMKVTDQIDAIRCLGANPLQEIILPRFIGIVISSFLLLGVGLIMSIGGGVVLGALFSNINIDEYFRHIPTFVTIPSILSGTFKSFVFAIALATICTFKGYSTTGGSKGVGESVVKTAVITMISIVICDWFTSLISETVLKIGE